MKNKNIAIIGMMILLTTNILAFAISSEYWEENPIKMTPGEIKQIQLTLQNMAGTEDLEAQGMITSGKEIAKIIGQENYQVPLGEKTTVTIEINIPKNVDYNTNRIIISFKTKSAGAGDFGLGSSIEREIPIIIMEKESKEKLQTNTISYILIGILVIIAILMLIPRFKKKKIKK